MNESFRGRLSGCASLVCALLFTAIATQAQATLGCSVSSELKGAVSAPLFQKPDETSAVLRQIPLGDMVFYPDDDLAPQKTEGWAWVRHDITQKDIWNSGDYGWMPRNTLSLCG